MPTLPTAQEQLALEYLNFFRTHPDQEYALLTAGAASDANVSSAISYFGVSMSALQTALASLSAVQPLAWNGALADAAHTHDRSMLAANTQSHQLPGEASVGERINAAGYTWRAYGENVYAYETSPLQGAAGFVIDWGYDTEDFDANGNLLSNWQKLGDGMQDPAGHRANMISSSFTEVGIGIIASTLTASGSVGPYLETQDLANRAGYQAQVLGVVIDDKDGDSFYDIGEGMAGVTVTLTGSVGSYTTTTWESGGYQLVAAAGTYTETFSGGKLAGTVTKSVTVGSQNVKVDARAQDATTVAATTHFPHDFNGDGHSDILWQRTGAVSAWSVGGAGGDQLQVNTYYGAAATSWKVVESFNFDGDGKADLVWRNTTTGGFAIWQATTGGFNQASYYASVGTDWSVAAAGDMTGDGKDDIVWRRADGAISVWASTGSGFNQNMFFTNTISAARHVVGLFDWDGDGRADLLLRDGSNNALVIQKSTGSTFNASVDYLDNSVGGEWKIVGLGDFNGDGKADILWRNDNGAVSVWTSTGAGFAKGTYNASVATNWSVAEIGDFNGDGKADILWHADSGAISEWRSNGAGFDQNVLYNNGPTTDWQVAAHDFLHLA